MKFLSSNNPWVFLVLVLLPLPVFAGSLDSKAREGISHYNREEFNQAAAKFEESQLASPENSDVAYNLANSHYRLGRYEDAVENYKKALAGETRKNLKQKSWYNMGNAYYRLGYMEEAIDAYKKALELNPSDKDSKFNLEWTRKQHQKAIQSGQVGPRDKNILQKPGTGKNANNPPDLREKSEESPNAKTAPSDSPEIAENKNGGKPDSSDQPPSNPTPDENGIKDNKEDQAVQDALHQMTQMTPEEAERWLGSLSENLKKISRRQMQGQMQDMFTENEKDW